MKHAMKSRVLLASLLMVAATLATAENTDPLMEAYRYTAPANSWYAAKIKPKMAMRAKVRAETPPPVPVDESMTRSPVAKSPVPPRALPFWKDLPASKP